MDTLDLFKDWTPEMIEYVKYPCSRPPISEYTRELMSKAQVGRIVSEETRKKISKAQLGTPKGSMSEEHKRSISKALMGKPKSEGHKRNISEGKVGIPLGTLSEKALESRRRYWASLSLEEHRKVVNNSIRSEKAILNSLKASHERPTVPEMTIDGYLKESFPGIYGYNGDYSLGVRVGNRIPDFVRLDGKKEVISVMGGIGRWHFLDDEKVEIEHYAKYGYGCIVVWEWDCWVPGELDKIFKEGNSGK